MAITFDVDIFRKECFEFVVIIMDTLNIPNKESL